MQPKLTFLFTALTLFSLLIALTGATTPVVRAAGNPIGLFTTGGPDSYGYTWDDSVTFSWIDVTSGANTGFTGSGVDQASGAISLPFSFNYYGNTYTQIYIAANGFISFTDQASPLPQTIPSSTSPNNVVAPYWTETFIDAGSWVHYASGGDTPNQYFVVEWHDVTTTSGANENFRFEVILRENGNIDFQYHTMTYIEDYSCGTSGIENSTGQIGLTYVTLCFFAPSPNKAVRFTRPLNTPTPTSTPTGTLPTVTRTPTLTPTRTLTPTSTQTLTHTPTQTLTSTSTRTLTPTSTRTLTPTSTQPGTLQIYLPLILRDYP